MARQPLPADTILGTGNDQYRIDTVLGPGGFGITYLARSLRLDRDVAIKEYFPQDFAYRDGSTTVRSVGDGTSDFFAQGKRYFVEEARVLGKFRHEHIVRVIGLLEENNTAYMILEFEEGLSFKNWLRELGHRPTQDELDSIMKPMLSALEAIHKTGIFHRDIAPDNIIIRPSGRPVLIDFGAARQFVRENSRTLGAIVKHGYSPPEQYTVDSRLQGAWSDIYALSATMFFAIVGHAPDEASKRQLHDTMLPIEDHMSPASVGLYHPSFLAGITAGLALRPRDRPQTIAEIRAILDEGRDDGPVTSPTRPRFGSVSEPFDGQPHAQTAPGTARSSQRWSAPSGSGPREPASAVAVASPERLPEATTLAVAYVAIGVAAISALGFLLIGGDQHPAGHVPLIAVCLGLCLAGLERGFVFVRPALSNAATTAVSTAIVSALMLAVYWLPLLLFPLTIALLILAGIFAWARYQPWIPITLMIVAVLHLVVALWMIFGAKVQVEGTAHSVGSYFWPLMAGCLAVISVLVLASAVQMRRRLGAGVP